LLGRAPLAGGRLFKKRLTNRERPSLEQRAARRVIALVLVTAAVCGIVFEPVGKGSVLLTLTDKHGIDTGDLPFIALLVIATWLARS
jgi:hypothetical protein